MCSASYKIFNTNTGPLFSKCNFGNDNLICNKKANQNFAELPQKKKKKNYSTELIPAFNFF